MKKFISILAGILIIFTMAGCSEITDTKQSESTTSTSFTIDEDGFVDCYRILNLYTGQTSEAYKNGYGRIMFRYYENDYIIIRMFYNGTKNIVILPREAVAIFLNPQN